MPAFQEHAENIAEKYLESLGHTRAWITRLDFEGGDTICINYEASHCSCCPPDHESEYMPIRYLWDENWEEEIDGIIAKRKAKAEREEAERKRKAEEAQRQRDLDQLAKLKAKYDTED